MEGDTEDLVPVAQLNISKKDFDNRGAEISFIKHMTASEIKYPAVSLGPQEIVHEAVA